MLPDALIEMHLMSPVLLDTYYENDSIKCKAAAEDCISSKHHLESHADGRDVLLGATIAMSKPSL